VGVSHVRVGKRKRIDENTREKEYVNRYTFGFGVKI